MKDSLFQVVLNRDYKISFYYSNDSRFDFFIHLGRLHLEDENDSPFLNGPSLSSTSRDDDGLNFDVNAFWNPSFD